MLGCQILKYATNKYRTETLLPPLYITPNPLLLMTSCGHLQCVGSQLLTYRIHHQWPHHIIFIDHAPAWQNWKLTFNNHTNSAHTDIMWKQRSSCPQTSTHRISLRAPGEGDPTCGFFLSDLFGTSYFCNACDAHLLLVSHLSTNRC